MLIAQSFHKRSLKSVSWDSYESHMLVRVRLQVTRLSHELSPAFDNSFFSSWPFPTFFIFHSCFCSCTAKNLFLTANCTVNGCNTAEQLLCITTPWTALLCSPEERKESFDRLEGGSTQCTEAMAEAGEVDIYRLSRHWQDINDVVVCRHICDSANIITSIHQYANNVLKGYPTEISWLCQWGWRGLQGSHACQVCGIFVPLSAVAGTNFPR